jgi:hypothetical protein
VVKPERSRDAEDGMSFRQGNDGCFLKGSVQVDFGGWINGGGRSGLGFGKRPRWLVGMNVQRGDRFHQGMTRVCWLRGDVQALGFIVTAWRALKNARQG